MRPFLDIFPHCAALFIVDNGHGITMPDVKHIFNLGTHNGTGSPEGKRAGSEAVGQYGLGLKTSILRIGLCSMVLTRSSATFAREKELPPNTLIYRIAIWPFNERKHLEQKAGDIPIKTADLLLEVVWSFDAAENNKNVQSFNPSIKNFESIKNSEALQFLKRNGPFDDLNDTKSMKTHLESMVKLFATKIHMETLKAVLNKTVCSRIKIMEVIEKLNKYQDKTEIINDKHLSAGCGTVLTVWDFNKKTTEINYRDHDIIDTGSCGNDLDETNGVYEPNGLYTKSLNNHISTLYANVSMTYHEYMTESAVRPMTTIFVQGRQIHPIYLRSLMHFDTIKIGNWKPKPNNPQKKGMSFEIGYLVPEYGCNENLEISYYRGVHYFYKNRRIVSDQPKYASGALFDVYKNKYPFCMLVNVTDFVNPNHSKNGLNGEWKVGNKNNCFEFMKKELKRYGELVHKAITIDDDAVDNAVNRAENAENDDRSVQSVPISLNSLDNENTENCISENLNHRNQTAKTPQKLLDLSSAEKLAVMQCSECRKIRRFALKDAPQIFGWESQNGIFRAKKSENFFKCENIGSVDECITRSSRISSGRNRCDLTDINTKMLKPIGGNAEQKWLRQENPKFLKQLKYRVDECVEKRFEEGLAREQTLERSAKERERAKRDLERDKRDSENDLRLSQRNEKLRLELKLNDSMVTPSNNNIIDDDELEITQVTPAMVNPKIELLEQLEALQSIKKFGIKTENTAITDSVNLVSSDEEMENDIPKTPEVEPEVDVMPNTPEFNENDLELMDAESENKNFENNVTQNSSDLLKVNEIIESKNQNSLTRNIENRDAGFYRESGKPHSRATFKKRKITNVENYKNYPETLKKIHALTTIKNRNIFCLNKNETIDTLEELVKQLKNYKD